MPERLINSRAGERLNKELTDEALGRIMRGLSPDAMRALRAVSEMRRRSPEDVLRDELRKYIADRLPLVDVEGIIRAMAGRFYEAGYFCGTVKRWLRDWSRNHS